VSHGERANVGRDRSAAVDREALIFLHIPKTAGTTLNRIIEWQYSPFAIFTMDPHRIRATAERFQRLPEARRRHLQVVRGHLFYGIHEFLPQDATYITMLREPVARLLSSYYFVLRRPLNPLHRKFKREGLGVEDCVRLFPDRNNTQCRFIAGVKDMAIADERLLDMAKENLIKSFSVVGICERFEESLILISEKFGWVLSPYENHKVAKIRPRVEGKLVDLISAYNRLDVELYEFGKKLFEESLRKDEETVREGLLTLRSSPKPGILKSAGRSIISAARFLLNKVVSAM